MKTWKWVATTSSGILHGELTGVQEKGETDKEAMDSVACVVRNFLLREVRGNVIACFVSITDMHINAPNTSIITLDIKQEFHVHELDESEVLDRSQAALKRLPANYPKSAFTRNNDGYTLDIGRTRIFGGVISGHEAVRRVEDYVSERDGFPNLPIGVIYGIYD